MVDNPFPAKAVTTFGFQPQPERRAVVFSSMRRVRDVMVNYLATYPSSGGALALSGAHGAGKTFSLLWLMQEAEALSQAHPKVIYAKADMPSFTELYRQIWHGLKKPELAELVDAALRKDAVMLAGAAKTTEAVGESIETTGSIEAAYASGVVDVNDLNVRLRRTLEDASELKDISRKVAAAFGLLGEPKFGEAAFDWLSGRNASLPNEALKRPLMGVPGEDSDEVAIAALEVLAELYRLSNTPLIILIDQTENLLTPTVKSSSLLKKLLEQLEARSALLVLAGTPASWKQLPRDVGPRLDSRAAIEVGNLGLEEVRALVDGYGGHPSEHLAEQLRELSGGNPREILQICHQLVQTRGERAWNVSRNALVDAANQAGTLPDRGRLAAELLGQLAEQLGLAAVPADWPHASPWDRRVAAADGRFVAAIVQLATDSLAEAELARSVTRLRRDLVERVGCLGVVLVSVGYASENIHGLIGTFVEAVIPFDERDFVARIRPLLLPLTISGLRSVEPETSLVLDERLERLESIIASIASDRAEAEARRTENVEARFSALSSQELKAREARTRHELRDGVDSLSSALIVDDLDRERAIVRALLISNQAHVHDEGFDVLAGFYLEAVELALGSRALPETRPGEGPSTAAMIRRLHHFRSDLLQALRRRLSPSGIHFQENRAYQIGSSIFVAIVAGAIVFMAIRSYVTGYLADYGSSKRIDDLRSVSGIWSIISAALGGLGYFGLAFTTQLPQFRYRRFGASLRQLRRSVFPMERSIAETSTKISFS